MGETNTKQVCKIISDKVYEAKQWDRESLEETVIRNILYEEVTFERRPEWDKRASGEEI